jgi:hypothetical protein
VSAAQIIDELPKLTAAELHAVRQKLAEISAGKPAVALRDRGIDEVQAADLRSRLKTFAEDWERPEAAIYDETLPRPEGGNCQRHIGWNCMQFLLDKPVKLY